MNNAPALANPANNRYLLAVGSTDTLGTAVLSDDVVPAFSPWPKRGATRGVDLVAPGVHIQGLRVPNSYIDLDYPAGQLGDRFFRGTGTSQSAALVSGAVALVLQKYPAATPDQVKALLMGSGYDINAKAQAIGGGELQLTTALTMTLPLSVQVWPSSVGTGSLELARGTDHVSDDGVVLAGEQDIFGHAFDSAGDGPPRSRRQLVVRWRLERQQLEWEQLVRQLVVRQQLEWEQLVRQLVVRQQLEWEQLVRQLVVRQQLEWEQLVRQLVVRQQLEHGRLGLDRSARSALRTPCTAARRLARHVPVRGGAGPSAHRRLTLSVARLTTIPARVAGLGLRAGDRRRRGGGRRARASRAWRPWTRRGSCHGSSSRLGSGRPRLVSSTSTSAAARTRSR